MKNTRKLKILQITFIAIMTALYVVLDIVSVRLSPNIKITFAGLPTLIAAIYLGPLSGACVGLLGSFIGQMLNYGFSATTILWILPPACRGLIMGLIFIFFKKSYKFFPLSVGIIVSSIAVTALNTIVIYIDSVVYGYYSFAYVFGETAFRFISSFLTAIALIIIITPVTIAINKQNFLHHFNIKR